MTKTSNDHGVQVREKIRSAIIGYIQEHGYSPSYREIGEMVGLKSNASVYAHIQTMMRQGMLETDAEYHSSRAIRVPGYKFVKEEE